MLKSPRTMISWLLLRGSIIALNFSKNRLILVFGIRYMPAIIYFLLLKEVSIKMHSIYGKTKSRSLLCVYDMPFLTKIEIPPPLSLKSKCWSLGLNKWIDEKSSNLHRDFLLFVNQVSVKISIPNGLLIALKNVSYSASLPFYHYTSWVVMQDIKCFGI